MKTLRGYPPLPSFPSVLEELQNWSEEKWGNQEPHSPRGKATATNRQLYWTYIILPVPAIIRLLILISKFHKYCTSTYFERLQSPLNCFSTFVELKHLVRIQSLKQKKMNVEYTLHEQRALYMEWCESLYGRIFQSCRPG